MKLLNKGTVIKYNLWALTYLKIIVCFERTVYLGGFGRIENKTQLTTIESF